MKCSHRSAIPSHRPYSVRSNSQVLPTLEGLGLWQGCDTESQGPSKATLEYSCPRGHIWTALTQDYSKSVYSACSRTYVLLQKYWCIWLQDSTLDREGVDMDFRVQYPVVKMLMRGVHILILLASKDLEIVTTFISHQPQKNSHCSTTSPWFFVYKNC